MRGIEFAYPYTTETLLVGERAPDYVFALFNETHSWIGFYGSQGDDRIFTLGFIIQDRSCSDVKETPVETQVIVQTKEEDESQFFLLALISGSVFGVIVGATVLSVWCCYRKKQKDLEASRPMADSIKLQLPRSLQKKQLEAIGEEVVEDYSDEQIG